MADLFGERVFTAREKLDALEREIRIRRRVYPKWVLQNRMTQKKADEEIAVLEAIANDYRETTKHGA